MLKNGCAIRDEALLRGCMKDAWPLLLTEAPQNSVIVCNTWDAPEPNSIDSRVHTGLHPLNLYNFVMGHHLDGALKHAFTQLRAGIQQGKRSFSMVCLDKHGKYGALALGKVLSEIVLADKFLTLSQVTVLVPETDMSCQPCDRCLFWCRKWTEKNAAVEQGKQLWRAMLAPGAS